MSVRQELGKVSVTPKGEFSAEITYERLDIIEHEGNSYIAVSDVPAGTELTDSKYWQRIASKGDKGDIGPMGPQGEPGKDAVVDATLTQSGKAADAKAVGDQLNALNEAIDAEETARKQDVNLLNDDLSTLDSTVFTVKRNESQLFDPSQESIGNLYVTRDKTIVESKLSYVAFLIPIEENKRYLMYCKSGKLYEHEYIVGYMSMDIPSIGGTVLNSTTVGDSKEYGALPATAYAKYMLIIVRTDSSSYPISSERVAEIVSNIGVEQIDSGYSYEGLPYSYKVENYASVKNVNTQWMGKTILWMGTSIPEGKDTALNSDGSGKSYPEMVAERLGATCINIALGSSMIRANTRTGDYTDGYSHNILRAFSATSAEKEYVIENWDEIRQKLRDPDTYTTLSDADKENCRNSSYEVRLLPYLNGTYPMPDLFVIDHGHNDHKYTLEDGSTDIGIAPTSANIGTGKKIAFDSNMFDGSSYSGLESVYGSLAKLNQPTIFKYSVNRNCYWGAVNFICTLIYKYNPRARIIFIGNLDDKQHEGLCDAQVAIARDWCVPIIRMWEKLGFGNHVIPGTYNYWGGTGLDLSQKQIYCKDGTHPHSDTTGKAMELYVDILTDEIRNCH